MRQLIFAVFLPQTGFQFTAEKPRPDASGITAVYLTDATGCSPCINSITSYVSFFRERGFAGLPLQQFVVVLDSSKERLRRFIATTDFAASVAFGYDEEYAPILQQFGKTTDSRQLLLVANENEKIFFRLHLTSGRMPTEIYKEKILNEAERAYTQIDRNSD